MEHETIRRIENLFHEKALLYADLVECFKKERGHLIAMEFDRLWSVSDEKNRLCMEIEALRSKIASMVAPENDWKDYHVNLVLDGIPLQQREPIRNTVLRIMDLKKEVEMIRRENKAFIDDSLLFLDELISILAGEGDREMVYNGRSRLCRAESVVTMNREV